MFIVILADKLILKNEKKVVFVDFLFRTSLKLDYAIKTTKHTEQKHWVIIYTCHYENATGK